MRRLNCVSEQSWTAVCLGGGLTSAVRGLMGHVEAVSVASVECDACQESARVNVEGAKWPSRCDGGGGGVDH